MWCPDTLPLLCTFLPSISIVYVPIPLIHISIVGTLCVLDSSNPIEWVDFSLNVTIIRLINTNLCLWCQRTTHFLYWCSWNDFSSNWLFCFLNFWLLSFWNLGLLCFFNLWLYLITRLLLLLSHIVDLSIVNELLKRLLLCCSIRLIKLLLILSETWTNCRN